MATDARTILGLFHAAAAAAPPERPAVESERVAYPYRELVERVQRLADDLHRRGVRRGDLVAICGGASPESIIGVLAALTAGAGFAMLDPGYPADRLAAMLALARPRAVLVDHATAQLAALGDWPRISLDAAESDGGGGPAPARSHAPSPHDVAYVVFTSGTTGAPKGVVVEHRGLVNLVEAQIDAFRIGPESRVLQFASPSFDAFVSEILTALCAGATLCLTGRIGARFDLDVTDVLERRRISVVTLPPSLLRAMPHRALPDLRTVVSAGEACTPEVVNRWAPGRRFLNAYGPSEVTVCSTMRVLTAGEAPTLGRAMAGLSAEVLDERLAVTADDAAGELYVAGVGVARGYLDRPDLTAERFVPDPRSQHPGERMYRTGDRVIRRSDGELEFVGRVDHQVKIRGFRIEPAEIELVLRAQPGVGDALVDVRKRPTGEPFLVAYLVTDAGLDHEALRAALGARLPRFMVPAQIVEVRAWPMSAAGKVDRAALARLPLGAATRGGPTSPAEREVATWFAELLGVEACDPDASFFAQGGDSVLLLRLIARVAAERGVRISLAALFESSSVRAVARLIAAGSSAGAGRGTDEPVALARGTGAEGGAPLWLIAPVHGNPICYMPLVAALAPDRPILGLATPGLDGERPPYDDLAALATHLIGTIRARQPEGPYRVGGWSNGGVVAFEIALQLQAAGAEVPDLALIAATPPSQDHLAAARENFGRYELWRICYMYARTMPISLGIDVSAPFDRFRDLPDDDALELLLSIVRGIGPFSPDATVDEIRPWLAVFQATLYGFHHYVDRGRYRGRALLVDPLETNRFRARDPMIVKPMPPGDWAQHIDGPLTVRRIGGNHFTIVRPPWVDGLAAVMREWWPVHVRPGSTPP